MNKIIVRPNETKDSMLSLTDKVIERLLSLGLSIYMDEKYRPFNINGVCFYSIPPRDADLLIVLGGDGSVIDASVLALELDIPLLGINLGKVGYLATLDPDEIDMLSVLVDGNSTIDEKMILVAEKQCNDGGIVKSDRFSVNDVIISHNNYLGLCDIKIENDRGDWAQYRADAIILATPAGSTAYSLSAGGPIIFHGLDSITVTPVCPHSFFNRSIVYGPDEVITVSNMNDNLLNISIDGRFFDSLNKGEFCRIYRSDKRIKMLNLQNTNFFSTLSKKIKLLHDLM